MEKVTKGGKTNVHTISKRIGFLSLFSMELRQKGKSVKDEIKEEVMTLDFSDREGKRVSKREVK